GFTTNGHTGEDVTLYIYAPDGVDLLTGTVENTDIAKYMELAMGVDLNDTTEKLFIRARDAFESKGATVKFDNITDVKNPVLIITKNDIEIKMPVNKNIAYVNGTPITLDGVVIFNGVTTYAPQSAIDLIQ
ncbi:MAG: stalk domain-containing protein, partial [Sedimentibacter sp.]